MGTSTQQIALAIVFGSILVAAAIFFSFAPGRTVSLESNGQPSPLRSENRLVYGSSEAETTIVEFSDYECPFCARLHPTLKRLVDESSGKIAWEFRHLPLPNHSLAFPAAVISECVADELGVPAFWQFSDSVFLAMGSLTADSLQAIALSLGLSEETYIRCQNDTRLQARVENDRQVAEALGGRGTPFNLIVKTDGTVTPVSGALPYEQWLGLLGQ